MKNRKDLQHETSNALMAAVVIVITPIITTVGIGIWLWLLMNGDGYLQLAKDWMVNHHRAVGLVALVVLVDGWFGLWRQFREPQPPSP